MLLTTSVTLTSCDSSAGIRLPGRLESFPHSDSPDADHTSVFNRTRCDSNHSLRHLMQPQKRGKTGRNKYEIMFKMQICALCNNNSADLIFPADRGGFKWQPRTAAAANRPVIRIFPPRKQGQNTRTVCNYFCFGKEKKTPTCTFASAKKKAECIQEMNPFVPSD